MKLRMLVLALIAALGSGCASTDKARLAYQVKPDSTVRHGGPNAQSYYQLARYYHGQKRLDMAETAYLKALELDSLQVDAYNALGSLYAERGDLARSAQQFEKALGIAPEAGYLYNNLGFTYYLLGRLDEAYIAVRKALLLDATLKRGWANLERIAGRQSNTLLVEAVKSRRVNALPTTLLATSVAGNAPSGSAPAPAILIADVSASTVIQRPSEPPRSSIAVVDLSTESTKAQRPEIAVAVVANPTMKTLPLAGKTEEGLEGGKFVLVSTSQKVVNLAEPLTLAKTEPTGLNRDLPLKTSVAKDLDIDLSKVQFEVTNANGVTGFARKFSAQLRQDNILVRRITNHDSYLLKETVIEYQPGYQNAAHTLVSRTQLVAHVTPAKIARAGSNVRILLGRDALPQGKTTPAKER